MIHRRDLLAAGAFAAAAPIIGGAASKPAATAGARSRIAPPPPRGHVSVPDFRKAGDADDSAAMTRAIATGRPVYLPKNGGSSRDGSYAAHRVALRPFTHISGDGPATVVRPAAVDTPAVFACMAASARASIPGIMLRDVTIVGHVAATGFSEHLHLVNFSGVSGLRIEYVTFSGFRGDGLMLGAEFADVPQREPRFNDDVRISNCQFDGLNGDNRNGISVIGGTRIVIDRCSFIRCTRPTMPGPIDFEPDPFPFYHLDRLSVTRCHFSDCGGNLGHVSVQIPAVVEHIPVGISIAGNVFGNYRGSGADIHLSINRAPDDRTPDMKVLIEGNRGSDGFAGVRIYSGRGVIVRDNEWANYRGAGFLGYVGCVNTVQDVAISDRYERCGYEHGKAFSIYNARNAMFVGNVFKACGNADAESCCVYFGPGETRYVSISNNDFKDNPLLHAAIIRDANHHSANELSNNNNFGALSTQ